MIWLIKKQDTFGYLNTLASYDGKRVCFPPHLYYRTNQFYTYMFMKQLLPLIRWGVAEYTIDENRVVEQNLALGWNLRLNDWN